MADNRIIISEMVIKNAPGNTTEVDVFGRQIDKAAQAAASGFKVIEAGSNQSAARIKANFDRIVASLNPLDAALHRIEREFTTNMRGIDAAMRKNLITDQAYTAAKTQLTDKRIADINREKQANLQALAANQNTQRIGMPGRSGTQSSLNALFQMQDISMMAYAGQAPMMTAMQQGTQLAGILEQVKSTGGSVGTTLMAAFTGLFNPISFLAITLVGLSTAAIQFGMEWLAVTDDSAEALKKQNDLIAQTADKWGEALPALRDYNDELERNAELADLAEARGVIQERQRERMSTALGSNAFRPLTTYLNRRLDIEANIPGSAPPNLEEEQKLNDLLDTIEGLQARIDQGIQPSFQELTALNKQFADTVGNSTDPEVQKLTASLQSMNAEMGDALKISRGLSQSLSTLISPEATGNLEDFMRRAEAVEAFAARVKAVADAALRAQYARDANIAGSEESRRSTLKFLEDAALRYRRLQFEQANLTEIPVEDVTIPVPDMQTELDLNKMRQDAIEKRADAADKAAKKEADALEKLRGENERLFEAEQKRLEQARDFVSAQEDKAVAAELELATMGMEEDARARLIDQMKVEQELRKTDVVLTQEQADAVREYASRATEAKITMDTNREALSDLNEQQKFATDQGMKLFDAWIEGGKELTDVFKDIANAIADAILQAVLFGQGPLAGFFGTKPAAGFDIGGIVGTILGNKAGAGPTAGAITTATTLAGTGFGGLRTVGPVGGGVDLMTTGATTAATMGTSMFASAGKTATGIDLVRIPFGNSYANVDARFAGNFAKLAEYLGSRGYDIQSMGEHGYKYRGVGGQSVLTHPSQHAFGQAVDINPRQNPYAYGATGNWAAKGIDPFDAARYSGLEYGGGWNKADTMHFQVPRGAQAMEKTMQQVAQSGKVVAQTNAVVAQTNTAVAQAGQQATGSLGGFGQALSQIGGGGGGGGGGWLSNIFSMFGGQGFGGGGFHAGSFIGGGGFTSSLATGWATRIAMGAAFSGGNIIPFARGGIVDGPHLFPMARGAGLMGEAGPEAVMPLTRGANGKLGVAMSGGNTGVVIHNYSTAEVKPRENQEGTGWEFVIEDRTADRINTFGTPLNKSVRNATGSRLKRR